MKRKKKISAKKKAMRALTLICPLVLIVGIVFAAMSCKGGEAGQSSLQPAGDSSADSSDVPSSAQPSSEEPSSMGTVTSMQPASSQSPVASTASKPPQVSSAAGGSKENRGIYQGVTWRSPNAKTAEVKYGRELILLNNSYELPEDFKWNLVYFSNGQPVDAASLNNAAKDKVQAVDAAAYQPLKDMFAAAKADGAPLQLVSPFRSISLQDRLFGQSVTANLKNGMSREDAIKVANISRTFPGTGDHNSGLGFDLSKAGDWSLTQAFDQTKEFRWLQEHAVEYGFILRYAKDKVGKTGIMYEPWHYRYVGVEHAQKIKANNMCLEEYIESLGG